MKNILLCTLLLGVSPSAWAQSHPGIQQKSVDGCDAWTFDDGTGEWKCMGSSGGGDGSSYPQGKCGPRYCSITVDGISAEVIFNQNIQGINYCYTYDISDGTCVLTSGLANCDLSCKAH